MVVFGDKNTGKYVEVKPFKENLLISWVNYPSEIIYHIEMHADRQSWLENSLHYAFAKCTNIFDARDTLNEVFNMGESVSRSLSEIQSMRDHAFDFLEVEFDDYWQGVFDALCWVLGDEVEAFN